MATIERLSGEQIRPRGQVRKGSKNAQVQKIETWIKISIAAFCIPGLASKPCLSQTAPPDTSKTPTLKELEKILRERVQEADSKRKEGALKSNSLRMDILSNPSRTESDRLQKANREKDSQNQEQDTEQARLNQTRVDVEKQNDKKDTQQEKLKEDRNPAKGTVKEAPTLAGDAAQMGPALLLSDVIASTYRAFPLLEVARIQSGVAGGQIMSAMGAYDLKVDYYSLNQPVGFYETFRQGIGVARQTWWGGYASAGYRIGRGTYEPWYKERETNDAGEFKVAWVQPLLQGRAIDPQRVELFQANLKQQAVAPEIQFQILVAGQDAAKAFWAWVEAGNALKVRERLLELAEKRGQQLEKGFAAGAVAAISLLQNNQEILKRQAKVIDGRQKFLDTAIKLSLFLRDEVGAPRLALPEWLPTDFPDLFELALATEEQDVNNAWAARPELQLLSLDIQSLRWDLSLARNQTLPNLDFTIQSVQNVGEGTSSLNDKGEFQLETGIIGGVPVQRRRAFGKMQTTQAKLAQLAQKYDYQRNKVQEEIRVARNAIQAAKRKVLTFRDLLKQSNETLEMFRKGLNAGEIDLYFLLDQEVKVNDAEVSLLEAEREFFIALASLQAALGLDPLEQATNLSARP